MNSNEKFKRKKKYGKELSYRYVLVVLTENENECDG